MSEFLEAVMMFSFGLSWPSAIIKSYTARTAKGKSLFFLIFILLGYACGIIAKIITDNISYVLIFYSLNFLMVFIDLLLFFRNQKLDALQEDHA